MISPRKFLPKMALLLGVALFSMPAVARADPTIDFAIPAPNAGTISYAGGTTNPLVGTGITVASVVGIMTPMNNGTTLTITNGVLAFTTGNFVNNVGNTSNFAAGGSLTITGTAGAVASGTLLSGTFVSAQVVNLSGTSKVTVDMAIDPLNAALAAFFGVNPSPVTTAINLSFTLASPATPPTAFTSNAVLSGDAAVTATATAVVPEPGTMLLALTGLPLLGVGRWLRRRNAA
jgi:hypothetical protein